MHEALGAGGGLRAARVLVSLVRKAKNEGCYPTNASAAATHHALPPPSEPLYPGSAQLCPWRGAVRCYFHSLKCALERDTPVPPGERRV